MLSMTLFGCGSKPKKQGAFNIQDGPPKFIPAHLDRIPNAIPRLEPLSRYGNRFKNSNSYVALNRRYSVMPTSRGYAARGLASWYGTKFQGRKTSSGEPYNMFSMTAAHRTLPLPTYAKVTNLDNGKSIVVKVNDRGPFHNNRLIDLSYVAAHRLGILGRGTGRVEVRSIDPRDHQGMVPHRIPLKPAFDRGPAHTTPKATALPNTPTSSPVLASRTASSPPKKKLAMDAKPHLNPTRLYIQLGAFNTKANALALVKEVQKLSPHLPQISENLHQNPRYRVRVGPLGNQKEATHLRQKLARARLPTPVIINE